MAEALVDVVARAILSGLREAGPTEYIDQIPRDTKTTIDGRFDMAAVSRAALAEIERAGYTVVPKEPTLEMLTQGLFTFAKTRDAKMSTWDIEGDYQRGFVGGQITAGAQEFIGVWRAMLEAAPKVNPSP
jgi:hypothetical protein